MEVSLPSYNTGVRMKDGDIGLDVGVNDANGNRIVWRGTDKNDADPSSY